MTECRKNHTRVDAQGKADECRASWQQRPTILNAVLAHIAETSEKIARGVEWEK